MSTAVIAAHLHESGSGASSADLVLVMPFLLAIVVYVAAVLVHRRSGRAWPWHRTVLWIAGIAAAAGGFVGPLAAASHGSFTAHMGAHLLVGMVAPLLLAMAAPVTLALRTMSLVPARRLSRLLRSPLGRALTHPVVAAVLNVGGMWALYLSPLYDLMQQVVLVHWLVMLHFLAAGYLYTVSLVAIDPSPHKARFTVRASVLVISLAAHGVLAKLLYASPPPGVSADDAQAGAQLMFSGGDAVDFVIIVLLCAEWYRATGRRLRVAPASASFDEPEPTDRLSALAARAKGEPS